MRRAGMWSLVALLATAARLPTAVGGSPRQALTPGPATLGAWGPTIALPLSPTAALVYRDVVLVWSADKGYTFTLPADKVEPPVTLVAKFNLTSGVVGPLETVQTNHDMFCPGVSLLPSADVMVSGGSSNNCTTFFSPTTQAFTAGATLRIPRAYHTAVTLSTGDAFVIGGSFVSGPRPKDGEVWSAQTGWRLLPGCVASAIKTQDRKVLRQDNHAWLFSWTNGTVFQAGPSKQMNWFSTAGNGTTTAAGLRAGDGDAMNGNAVMYDAANGKILTLGGSPDYDNSTATANAHVITIAPSGQVSVAKVASMKYSRAYCNSVVLPTGKVLVTGGQSFAAQFRDSNAILATEVWDPVTATFAELAPASTPRTYHSFSVLLPDGRILSGGGGLCQRAPCPAIHFDADIFSPPYLFDAGGALATRPRFRATPAAHVRVGATFRVTTNVEVSHFAATRLGSVTHSINSSQRRVRLTAVSFAKLPVGAAEYVLRVVGDAGIMTPGPWFLWAISAEGVPSVARTILIAL